MVRYCLNELVVMGGEDNRATKADQPSFNDVIDSKSR